MAKQSGIHQLKGKVGEMSYYQSTGISGGLVRRINQGLSERVKTDEAFANTRLNNAEFGQAARIASVSVMYITPKFRPMILPFSQSKLSRLILEDIKTSGGNWGERNFSDADGEKIAPMLNTLAKTNFSRTGVSLTKTEAEFTVSVNETIGGSFLDSIGADGFDVRVVYACSWIGSHGSNGYAPSYARGNRHDFTDLTAGQTESVEILGPSDPPQGWPAAPNRFIVCVVMPYREINGVKHILQEHCTFACKDSDDGILE